MLLLLTMGVAVVAAAAFVVLLCWRRSVPRADHAAEDNAPPIIDVL
jgi:hypothetical protein